MPLPAGGTWPPREIDVVTARLAVWSAWYSGDPDQLSDIYGGALAGDPGTPLTGFLNPDRPGLRGAIGRTLARWFWGIPTPNNEKRTKLHLPVAADMATVSADLLFSEPPTITVDHQPTQDRLAKLADDSMHANLLEAAEVGAGLGGVYLRVCWDKTIADYPWISSVHADAAVPEFRYGRLTAVTFWRSVFEEGGRVVRHLERHEKGVILHGLYDGGRGDLGKQIPLDAFPETNGLDPIVETRVPMLTADYVPNMRPARVWRQHPAAAYLGRADFSGAEPFMDALDETYSSWMRDIRHAKARLIVAEQAMQNLGPGNGSYFDADREVYESLAMLSKPGDAPLTQVQFAIRVKEHAETAQHLLDKIVRIGGYSGQTFGESGDAATMRTATEIKARQQRSYVTRDKKLLYTRPPLSRMVLAMLAVDRAQFGSEVREDVEPDIEFGDTVSEDPQTLAQTAQLLHAAEAASIYTRVQMVNPEWDDAKVKEEVARIREEQQPMNVPGLDAGMGPSGPGAPLDPLADPSAMDPAMEAMPQ